jgi:hypothetical protein
MNVMNIYECDPRVAEDQACTFNVGEGPCCEGISQKLYELEKGKFKL